MKEKLKIEGMHCESCAKMIEMELEDKVNSISISYPNKEAIIDFDDKKINKIQIKNIIKSLGYKIQ